MPRTYGTTNLAPYPAAPAVGLAGDTYYNTTEKQSYVSDGTAWNTAATPVGAGSASYKWNTATAAADPGSGKVAINNAAPASATVVYASVYDQSGTVIRLDAINVGDTFAIYQTGAIGTSVKYTVSGATTNNGPNQWFTIPVTYVSTGSSGFAPSNNTSVQMQSTAAPSSATAINPATDFNACTTTGLYSIASNATNGLPNQSAANVGVLQVFATDATHVSQVWLGGSNSAPLEIWNRSCNAGTWARWESVMGRIPGLGNFDFASTNGIYSIAGTATSGPGVTGNGVLTVYGSQLGTVPVNNIQTWTSYVTGEVWQRFYSASGSYSAWAPVPLAASGIVEKVWSGTAYVWPGPGGAAPPANTYSNILFLDPTGTHDPVTSTGGRTVVNDLWEAGGQAPQTSGTIVQEFARTIIGGWGTTNSATYVVIAGLGPISINKQFAGTQLEFTFGMSGFVTGAANSVQIGASPTNSGANVTINGQFFFNEVSSHRHWTGLNSIPGLAVGTYSCSWWVKVASTATTITSDANDSIWGRVREMWP